MCALRDVYSHDRVGAAGGYGESVRMLDHCEQQFIVICTALKTHRISLCLG